MSTRAGIPQQGVQGKLSMQAPGWLWAGGYRWAAPAECSTDWVGRECRQALAPRKLLKQVIRRAEAAVQEFIGQAQVHLGRQSTLPGAPPFYCCLE